MSARDRSAARRLFALTRTIRFRFSLWVASLVVVILATLAAAVFVSLSKKLYLSLDDSLRLSASEAVAAMNIESGRIVISDGGIEEIATVLDAKGFSLRLIDGVTGRVRVFGDLRPVSRAEEGGLLERGRSPFFSNQRDAKGALLRVFTTPIEESRRLIGVLQVARPTRFIEETLAELLLTVIIAGPVLVIIGGVGAYFLVRQALSPIDHLTKAARGITAESLSDRLPIVSTDDEVGRLASTFGEMITRLSESFHRERQFSSDLSHELRTPLAAIEMIISVIREKRRSPPEYEKALDDLGAEVGRIKKLTEEMLLLLRLGAAEPRRQESVDLSDLVRGVGESLKPLARAKGLTLTARCEPSLRLRADADRLIRLLVNIVDNAIKFTEVGEVRIEAARGPGSVLLISVADTGCGMANEHLGRIFDRLYRIDGGRSVAGSGLGLAIAKQIAVSMGGAIEVTSVLHRGSRFTIRLPAT